MPAPHTPLFKWQHEAQAELEAMMHARVAEMDFPCVGAKAALAKGTLHVLACNRIDSSWDDLRIHDGLLRFAEAYKEEPALFRSFAVVFEGPDDLSEAEFEKQLWKRAQSISDKDVWRGQSYDDAVSPDPESPHFSLSFGGEAFFIVGLHPNASRPARRFPRPTMVFNLHDQFETLRAQNKYENMREKIMVRDEAYAGSRNPMLARHGDASEARQYSGRVVDADWKCPFSYSGPSK
ncbi:guanitoxin biosynthesis heme-dependent pre-guanitoxin N-hydroxylase GntA [Sphingomonas qilianensis]|uniref:Guanitoxin biosynthesis heme-dependent pre-guanitoxin N-hydroxylase GntA n=1 Tax=Sphingomonas qilianensis TaxID=1736690 RepID=A0ABU9XPN9_9SPHN